MSTVAEMWQRAAAGDPEAFAAFYERHADRVFTHCRNRLRSIPEAEDVTAQVFLIAWRDRARVRYVDDADILPWLLITANHLLAHDQRMAVRRSRLFAKLGPPMDLPDTAEVLVERETLEIEQAQVISVLNSLRKVDREVLELCVVHGMSAVAAGEALHIPPSTVRSRLARALHRARKRYEADSGFASGIAPVQKVAE